MSALAAPRRPGPRPSVRTALVVVTAIAALAASACSGGSDGSESSAASDASVSSAGGDTVVGAPEPAALGSVAGAVADSASYAEKPTGPTGPTGPSVISTGTIRLESDDVADARRSALAVVEDLGGSVADEDTRTDTDGDTTRSRLVLRVPSRSFGDAMERLSEVGDLRASSTTAQDVTTQVLDTAVRVRVQRAGIRRITALLDRAGSLRDVIRIESELSRRQADLDSLVQQQKYLADQTSLGTITVGIDRTGTLPPDDERTGFLGGLRSGWDAFTSAGLGLATAAGAALPFLVLAAALATVVLPLRRRRRGRAQSAIG